MKSWISLFIQEMKYHEFQIPQEILDKILFLFNNLEDYEVEINNFICETQKQMMIAQFYYQYLFFQYYWRIGLYNSYYNNLYAAKSPQTTPNNSPLKRMRLNALDYIPPQKA